MIVYLGMPRCASTWIYKNLGLTETKETHYLYTDATDPEGYVASRTVDFSTNNWSMDSDVAQIVDLYATKYIFIFREPLDLAKSYYKFLKLTTPFSEFVQSMIDAKLLCLGDILERWINLVDSKKIFIYNYTDINEEWLKQFASDFEFSINEITDQHKNASPASDADFTITEQQQTILSNQWIKLQQLIKEHNYGN